MENGVVLAGNSQNVTVSRRKERTKTMNKRRIIATASLAAALAVTGCATSHGGDATSAAKSAAASLSADPQFQKLSAELKANMTKDFKLSHPVASMEQAVQETFPGSSGHAIVSYAVKTFKLKDRKAGPDRDAWIHGVVTYALQQSAQGTGTSTSQPSIPGVSSSKPSTS